jgi:hypothetical protein
MPYDLDNPSGSGECPKCRFTMEPLRHSALLNTDGGYMLDNGVGWDPDDHVVTSTLFGSPSRFLWRHFGEPLIGRLISTIRNRRYQNTLKRFPRTLVCTHCRHLVKRK